MTKLGPFGAYVGAKFGNMCKKLDCVEFLD